MGDIELVIMGDQETKRLGRKSAHVVTESWHAQTKAIATVIIFSNSPQVAPVGDGGQLAAARGSAAAASFRCHARRTKTKEQLPTHTVATSNLTIPSSSTSFLDKHDPIVECGWLVVCCCVVSASSCRLTSDNASALWHSGCLGVRLAAATVPALLIGPALFLWWCGPGGGVVPL